MEVNFLRLLAFPMLPLSVPFAHQLATQRLTEHSDGRLRPLEWNGVPACSRPTNGS